MANRFEVAPAGLGDRSGVAIERAADVKRGGYARSYRKHGELDRERFAKWLVVAAAMRASYDHEGHLTYRAD